MIITSLIIPIASCNQRKHACRLKAAEFVYQKPDTVYQGDSTVILYYVGASMDTSKIYTDTNVYD